MTKTSRFNYIKRGLVGVCAATMLTGLCAGTAFAAGETYPSVGSDTSSGSTGTTAITAKATDAQIKATIPTQVYVKMNTDGTLQFPSNISITADADNMFGLKVSGVKATVGSGLTDYSLATTSTAGAKEVYLGLKKSDSDTATVLAADTDLKSLDLTAAPGAAATPLLEGSIDKSGLTYGMVTAESGFSLASLAWTVSPVD